MISGARLIRSDRLRIHARLSSTCTRSLGKSHARPALALFHIYNQHSAAQKGSRIVFTRASSSSQSRAAPVSAMAVYPNGPTHFLSKDDLEDDTEFFTTSITKAGSADAPKGFSDYDIRWKEVKVPTLSGLIPIYMDLAKARLAALVTLTTMCGYAISPASASLPTLFSLTAGTALCIASANAYNQFVEPPYDAQMSRTRNRILVRKAISPLHAWSFATLTGISGVGLLAVAVNPLTAVLGAANLVLYAGIYTPMKRMSIANTWAGAIVGAIPPMMGWAACTNSLDPEAWLLGAILYAWQFPHFNSLAWNLRADYSKAGYRMMAVTDPKLNARVSLRYSLALIPLVTLAPYMDMTSWWFAIDGNIVNGVMLAGAANFWRKKDDKTARQLFFGSLIHLPILLALMMFHKKSKESQEHVGVPSAVALGSTEGLLHEEEDDDEYEYVDEDEDDGEEDHSSVQHTDRIKH
ncbi:Protoheme IX farnesyltransferase, mitochondrial [Lunasporangiospora selenospora]|uniref:Protoheme IX farnesyltransferase, mitochondrial n=1 Tax=Lunasporangiospora selenospora TaxID=979761 RepID=A0A9P6KEZ1_9FUNG|nr:Protoheme IX farnesyltransferase, mitochondrial [Lunasporangiospora selenospora]